MRTDASPIGPLAAYEYDLPPERIAIEPTASREDARLLVYERIVGEVTHSRVADLPALLRPGDLLVLNSARVDPARVLRPKPGGGTFELLFLRPLTSHTWLALAKKQTLPFGPILSAKPVGERGLVELSCDRDVEGVRRWLGEVGLPPLPPYIRSARKKLGMEKDRDEDRERYQTTYAKEPGAVAAPTAGLHFTPKLLEQLRQVGVETGELHLSVGWGTFKPLSAEDWEAGKLHEEWVVVPEGLARQVLRAKAEGRRIVAVGTTVVRSLEWWAAKGASREGAGGWCDLFLRPPWQPAVVDAMITNFHLPGSSLMALVAGFLREDGVETLKRLYGVAIEENYRFYSYGDAMLIL